MYEHWTDIYGRELGKCGYCLKDGRAANLKKLPKELRGNPVLEYCPICYPDVLEAVKKFPWNKGKWYQEMD